jgi:RimJ/RimL family protein N-acetyltransferase
MDIRIQKDNNELWSIQKLDSIRKNAKSLGLTEEACDELRRTLLLGEVLPVVKDYEHDFKENFCINSDGETVGNITLTLDEDSHIWEIDIFIYDDFQGKGIAYKALRQLIDQHEGRRWEANVLESNPNLAAMCHLFLKLNFTKDKEIIPNSEGIPVHLFTSK